MQFSIYVDTFLNREFYWNTSSRSDPVPWQTPPSVRVRPQARECDLRANILRPDHRRTASHRTNRMKIVCRLLGLDRFDSMMKRRPGFAISFREESVILNNVGTYGLSRRFDVKIFKYQSRHSIPSLPVEGGQKMPGQVVWPTNGTGGKDAGERSQGQPHGRGWPDRVRVGEKSWTNESAEWSLCAQSSYPLPS